MKYVLLLILSAILAAGCTDVEPPPDANLPICVHRDYPSLRYCNFRNIGYCLPPTFYPKNKPGNFPGPCSDEALHQKHGDSPDRYTTRSKYFYDAHGRLTAFDPEFMGTEYYQYDAAGNTTQAIVYASTGILSYMVSYEYGDGGTEQKTTIVGGDNGGQIIDMRMTTYRRDTCDPIVDASSVRKDSTTYTYDSEDRLIRKTINDDQIPSPDHTLAVEYSYKLLGNGDLQVIADGLGFFPDERLTYDENGRLALREYGSLELGFRHGAIYEFIYSSTGDLLTATQSDSSEDITASYSYSCWSKDAEGNWRDTRPVTEVTDK